MHLHRPLEKIHTSRMELSPATPYRRFAKTFGEREFRLFESWLDRYANNWAHCDGLSIYLFAAPAIAKVPELARELPKWTTSKKSLAPPPAPPPSR